jgi:hypothetical protein
MDKSYADELDDALEKVYFKLVRNNANRQKETYGNVKKKDKYFI